MFVSRSLADLRVNLGKLSPDHMLWAQGVGNGPHELVAAVGGKCRELGLRTSQRCTEDALRDIEHGITADALINELIELDNTIRREMSTRWFFFLSDACADFYDQKELFGADVNVKFPSIAYDTVEAGNCCAMGRSTACVFHLMRIMEVGVQAFGTKLGVTLTCKKNWQSILDESNKAIKLLSPKDPVTVELSQASANLYAVKQAWRNEVMHPKDTYTLEEAENLIRLVKIFMGQLASII